MAKKKAPKTKKKAPKRSRDPFSASHLGKNPVIDVHIQAMFDGVDEEAAARELRELIDELRALFARFGPVALEKPPELEGRIHYTLMQFRIGPAPRVPALDSFRTILADLAKGWHREMRSLGGECHGEWMKTRDARKPCRFARVEYLSISLWDPKDSHWYP